MKTVKIKIELSPFDASRVETTKDELLWCWNRLRVYALRHQCLDWYKWAEKQSDGSKLYPAFDLEGIIKTPLMFAKSGAWNYASCQIAVGGPYWTKDVPNTIPFKENGKVKYKHSVKLVDGDLPYERIPIKLYELPTLKFKGIESVNMKMLNADRKKELLPDLTMFCRYYYGLNADFIEAWSAYVDPKLSDRGQPLYKDGKQRKITCLYNKYPPRIDTENNLIEIENLGENIVCYPCDREWVKRVGNKQARSYRLVELPSGLYLCVTVANRAECGIPTAKAAQKMVAMELKANNPGASKEEMKALRENSPEYKASAENLAAMQQLSEQLNYEDSTCRNNAQQTIKVKPGVNYIAQTERLKFQQNRSRFRADNHIAELQQQLDIKRNSNDKKTGKSWLKGERELTTNEKKLVKQIARLHERAKNSTNAFNHKLSTRLVRMGSRIEWDELPVDKLISLADPILDEDGLYYHPNGNTQKTLLNRMLKNSSIGDLQSKFEGKAKIARKEFVAV
jgi:hypothetical protein